MPIIHPRTMRGPEFVVRFVPAPVSRILTQPPDEPPPGGGRVAPTVSTPAECSWITTAASKPTTTGGDTGSGGLTWTVGDKLYAIALSADDGTTFNVPTVTTAGQNMGAFSQIGNSPSGASRCRGTAWEAVASGSGSSTITANRAAGTDHYGIIVWRVSGSDGVGTVSATVSTAIAESFATTADASAVLGGIADWFAEVTTNFAYTPSGATNREATEDGSTYTVFAMDWADRGAVATVNHGLTTSGGYAASGGNYTKILVEVQGTSTGGGVQNADATLTVTSAQTATAASDKPVDAALTGTAALTAAAASTKPVDAALTATATITAAASVVKPVDATRTTTATLTATADSDKPAAAALTGTATATGTAASTKPVDATLTGTAAITATAASTKPVDAALTTTATITATADVVGAGKSIDATVTVTDTITATAASSKPVDATLTGTATLTPTAASTKPVDATRSSTATLTAAAASTKPVAATLTGTATVTPTAASTKPVTAALTATAAITADATVSTPPKTIDAAPTFTATLTATGQAARPATATLTVAATVTATATVVHNAQATLTGTATIDTSAFIGVLVIPRYGIDGTATAALFSGLATAASVLSGTATAGPTLAGDTTSASTSDEARATVTTLG